MVSVPLQWLGDARAVWVRESERRERVSCTAGSALIFSGKTCPKRDRQATSGGCTSLAYCRAFFCSCVHIEPPLLHVGDAHGPAIAEPAQFATRCVANWKCVIEGPHVAQGGYRIGTHAASGGRARGIVHTLRAQFEMHERCCIRPCFLLDRERFGVDCIAVDRRERAPEIGRLIARALVGDLDAVGV